MKGDIFTFIWATDADHAVELAGHGAEDEFDSLLEAVEAFDKDLHEGRSVFQIEVKKVFPE